MEELLCGSCGEPTFKCSCNDDWVSFNKIIKANCSGDIKSDIKYTDLNISTMTICFNFNQQIDLVVLKQILEAKLDISYKPGSRKSKDKKKKGTDSFYNSFDIKLTFVDRSTEPMVFSNVSIFIFPNGKVKAAGIRTIATINIMTTELIEMIKYVNLQQKIVNDIHTFNTENTKIQMICSDFKIKPIRTDPDGWCIRQEELKNLIIKNGHSATFSALSRYPGINMKYPSVIQPGKQISLLIFRSGSIIITGAKYARDIADSYIFITDLISKNNDLFYYDINEEIKQKKKKKLLN
jgi:TATA-box binding protein (TBP) (component of TFIID and TFIIIB)